MIKSIEKDGYILGNKIIITFDTQYNRDAFYAILLDLYTKERK